MFWHVKKIIKKLNKIIKKLISLKNEIYLKNIF
jgi:hypothetical protein